MQPAGLSTSDLVMILIAVAGGVGAILLGQHGLITSLLKDRWAAHEKTHEDLEARIRDHEEAASDIALKVNTLETAFQLRKEAR